jgi:putative FmdB family regulatory protein
MPLYEYHCNDCEKVFEKIVSFSEANRNPVCPNCQSQHTHKKISKIASIAATAGSIPGSTSSSCGSSGRFS